MQMQAKKRSPLGHRDSHDRLEPPIEVVDQLSIKGAPDAKGISSPPEAAERAIFRRVCNQPSRNAAAVSLALGSRP